MRRIWLPISALMLVMAVGAAVTVAAGMATNAASEAKTWPGGLKVIQQYPFQCLAATAVLGLAAAVALWWLQRLVDHRQQEWLPARHRPEPWVVQRPTVVSEVVAELRRGTVTVGVTTALQGAGGFGKTTVAQMVWADRRVLRLFKQRVYWVTLGRDVQTKEAIAARVNDVIALIDPAQQPTFTDPQAAGQALGALLDRGPRRLLILDDVWEDYQLKPFQSGRGARLITTRNPYLIPGANLVQVDQMTEGQARTLLTWNLPPLPEAVIKDLLGVTGRWALLLHLANKILLDQARRSSDLARLARDLCDKLRRRTLDVDELSGASRRALDVGDSQQRREAVTATIEASTGLLTGTEPDRFAELAVFVEDETVPVPLVTRLWQATGSLDEMATRDLCGRLAELGLLTLSPTATGGFIAIHDVIRDYLLEKLADRAGPATVRDLHGRLLDAVAATLPPAEPLQPAHVRQRRPVAAADHDLGEVVWQLQHDLGPQVLVAGAHGRPRRPAGGTRRHRRPVHPRASSWVRSAGRINNPRVPRNSPDARRATCSSASSRRACDTCPVDHLPAFAVASSASRRPITHRRSRSAAASAAVANRSARPGSHFTVNVCTPGWYESPVQEHTGARITVGLSARRHCGEARSGRRRSYRVVMSKFGSPDLQTEVFEGGSPAADQPTGIPDQAHRERGGPGPRQSGTGP